MSQFFKFLVGFFAVILVFSANADMQKIDGAQAFFADKQKQNLMVRIGVDPGVLSKNASDTKTIMEQITVIGCAFGNCEFAKANSGLGFFEFTTEVSDAVQKMKSFELLVVACSKLGCDKQNITSTIFMPVKKKS